MNHFPQIKHDSDGKLFYEMNNKIHWVTEVPIYVGDNVAIAFNNIIKLVEENLNPITNIPTICPDPNCNAPITISVHHSAQCKYNKN